MPNEHNLDNLSRREKAVLKLAAKGLTDDGIANSLRIARSTVLTYWARIRKKRGASRGLNWRYSMSSRNWPSSTRR